MQFHTSEEHPDSNRGNCFLPTTLSGDSAANTETCLEQGLFGRNHRMLRTSPRMFRIWRGDYTSRHELLFFPNDELVLQSEEEQQVDSCNFEEEESLTEDDETWEIENSRKELEKDSVSHNDIQFQDCQDSCLEKISSEPSLVSEELSCVAETIPKEYQ